VAAALPVSPFHALDDWPSRTSFSPRLFGHAIARLHEVGYRPLSPSGLWNTCTEERPFRTGS